MNPWFADTFYFLALRNPKDVAHPKAVALTSQVAQRRLITTAWVLTEVADALAAPENRAGFGALLQVFGSNPMTEIVGSDHDLFERGVQLYQSRPDKGWSLTDCISFVVMEDRKISEALTGDHHFEQAGFQALLK